MTVDISKLKRIHVKDLVPGDRFTWGDFVVYDTVNSDMGIEGYEFLKIYDLPAKERDWVYLDEVSRHNKEFESKLEDLLK